MRRVRGGETGQADRAESASRRLSGGARHQLERLTTTLFGTLAGRVLVGAALAKTLLLAIEPAGGRPAVLQLPNTIATLALVAALGYFLVRLLVDLKRRMLWRVRRKLILSYVFIGFVPVLLIAAFFILAGLMLFLNTSAYLVKNSLDDVVAEALLIAETTAGEIRRAPEAAARGILERKLAGARERYPWASLALVPRQRTGAPGPEPVAVGAWAHGDPPRALPSWIGRAGFGGLLAYESADEDDTQLVVRAASLAEVPDPAYAVVVDLPVEGQVLDRIREATGIKVGDVSVVQMGGDAVPAAPSRPAPAGSVLTRTPAADGARWGLDWVSFFDFTDWETGRIGKISLAIQVRLADMYERITLAQARVGNFSLGAFVVIVLGAIGLLFLIIEGVALVAGFVLARSITGAVHELFMGTERVRQGDFRHRIRLRSQDQLGQLAESFNSMTGSIEDLLQQAAEKRRLEEELRIARQIQMSLLPAGPVRMPGVNVTALCVPAREVGGDYYDFFPLDDHRIGLLIADVSGKGTSAALYMAELKGLVLSLSQIYHSPKQLLIEVNRLLADHLDSRSFITMTYAVLDLAAGTLTYARAGHTPLIYLPSTGAARGRAQVLAPDGLVLGLRLDGFEQKFRDLLQEASLSISEGDVFVFFTDGITEAMNEASDLFGETRLSRLVEEHGHLPADELRERILREIETFVGRAEQHDDMTMILLKVEEVPVATRPEAVAAAAI